MHTGYCNRTRRPQTAATTAADSLGPEVGRGKVVFFKWDYYVVK
jgi:hypothetical protein